MSLHIMLHWHYIPEVKATTSSVLSFFKRCSLFRFSCIKAATFMSLGYFSVCVRTWDLAILEQAYETCTHFSIWHEVFVHQHCGILNAMYVWSEMDPRKPTAYARVVLILPGLAHGLLIPLRESVVPKYSQLWREFLFVSLSDVLLSHLYITWQIQYDSLWEMSWQENKEDISVVL